MTAHGPAQGERLMAGRLMAGWRGTWAGCWPRTIGRWGRVFRWPRGCWSPPGTCWNDIGAAQPDAAVRVDPLVEAGTPFRCGGGAGGPGPRPGRPHHRDTTACLGRYLHPDRPGGVAHTRVTVTGHVLVEDDHSYRFLDAPGEWAGGTTRDDAVPLGRMTSTAVMRGMSGAPVIRDGDAAVIGVVSGRYNTADGWLTGTVWVARIEDLLPLLDDLANVAVETGPAGRAGRPDPGSG